MKRKHAATGAPRHSSGPGASTQGGTFMNRGKGKSATRVPDMYAGKGKGGHGRMKSGK